MEHPANRRWTMFGHAALKFRLKEEAPERKEYELTRMMKVIIDGKDMVIVFKSNVYDEFVKGQ